ncbi:hypothetical protein [Rhodococcus sp. SJ-3]
MFERNVADSVHRIAHADVNVYLVEDNDGIETAVEAALRAGPP